MAAAAVPLVGGLLASCSGGVETACPAVAWGSVVVVELAGGWAAVDVGSVDVECAPTSCAPMTVLEEGTGATLAPAPSSAPLTRAVDPSGPLPESAVVTVLAPDGRQLARLETDLEFVRVGGSEECGGPMEARVEVPAP